MSTKDEPSNLRNLHYLRKLGVNLGVRQPQNKTKFCEEWVDITEESNAEKALPQKGNRHVVEKQPTDYWSSRF